MTKEFLDLQQAILKVDGGVVVESGLNSISIRRPFVWQLFFIVPSILCYSFAFLFLLLTFFEENESMVGIVVILFSVGFIFGIYCSYIHIRERLTIDFGSKRINYLNSLLCNQVVHFENIEKFTFLSQNYELTEYDDSVREMITIDLFVRFTSKKKYPKIIFSFSKSYSEKNCLIDLSQKFKLYVEDTCDLKCESLS